MEYRSTRFPRLFGGGELLANMAKWQRGWNAFTEHYGMCGLCSA